MVYNIFNRIKVITFSIVVKTTIQGNGSFFFLRLTDVRPGRYIKRPGSLFTSIPTEQVFRLHPHGNSHDFIVWKERSLQRERELNSTTKNKRWITTRGNVPLTNLPFTSVSVHGPRGKDLNDTKVTDGRRSKWANSRRPGCTTWDVSCPSVGGEVYRTVIRCPMSVGGSSGIGGVVLCKSWV